MKPLPEPFVASYPFIILPSAAISVAFNTPLDTSPVWTVAINSVKIWSSPLTPALIKSFSIKALKPASRASLKAFEEKVAPAWTPTFSNVESLPTKLLG